MEITKILSEELANFCIVKSTKFVYFNVAKGPSDEGVETVPSTPPKVSVVGENAGKMAQGNKIRMPDRKSNIVRDIHAI